MIIIIDSACIVCGEESYETVGCLFVCFSIDQQQQQWHAVGLLLSGQPTDCSRRQCLVAVDCHDYAAGHFT